MNPVHVLIKMAVGYGLGDYVQLTSVIRHVRSERPFWIIDFQGDAGRCDAMIGNVRNVFTFADVAPSSRYDREIEIQLYDNFASWTDRPNTRVSNCLHERFGMMWSKEWQRYQINVLPSNHLMARGFLQSLPKPLMMPFETPRFGIIGIHYQGDSSQPHKNLSDEQAFNICRHISCFGKLPLLFDWRACSPLPSSGGISTVAHLKQRERWGRSAQMNAAIINQCEAFIGIDSGPGKCASATSTPTLIIWTHHHPALFHDPSPNTTHLVPSNHRDNPLLKENKAVADFFEKNYNWLPYVEGSLEQEVNRWLERIF